MTLFSFPDYRHFATTFRTELTQAGEFVIARHNNQELHASVSGSVDGCDCSILGSIAPPDEQMFSVLLLAHTLKQAGASRVTGILPYLAYTRQDKAKAGESLAAAWIGSLLMSSGFDRILTVDVHSERDHELLSLPLISLSTAKLFAETIQKNGLRDATFVAADRGAIARCDAVKQIAGLPIGETPHFEKTRTSEGVIHGDLIGEVGSKVIFVDDMLDTGGTLVSACERLVNLGVEEIYIFVTHGLFTGDRWERLWSLGVKHIFCTDTVQPLACDIEWGNITVLPVGPLLRKYIVDEGEAGRSGKRP